MDICESILGRKRHDSERSTCSILEQNDMEAVEALVCTSPALPPQGRRDLKLLPAHFRGAWVPEHPPELPDSRELFLV